MAVLGDKILIVLPKSIDFESLPAIDSVPNLSTPNVIPILAEIEILSIIFDFQNYPQL
jgi:hypothetical protein